MTDADTKWQVECSQKDDNSVCCNQKQTINNSVNTDTQTDEVNKKSGGYTSKIMKLEQKYKKL